MFGFTGSPILSVSAGTAVRNSKHATTKQTFGDQLRIYTIVDTTNDKTVLPFRVDCVRVTTVDADIDGENV